jgi:hypothetical protein
MWFNLYEQRVRLTPIEDGQTLKNEKKSTDRTPASVGFEAEGKKGGVIGLTRRRIGHHRFAAAGYCWCGNIRPLPMKTTKADASLTV